MQNKNIVSAHVAAVLTIFLWGTTYISTKLLLVDFLPVEILLTRFIIAYVVLWLAYPHWLKTADKHQELMLALAGLCGITLYYLLENIALVYTLASNVGVISAVAPFFTAFLAAKFFRERGLNFFFLLGFGLSMLGIMLLNFGGADNIEINPKGDFLALAASFVWGIYSNLMRKISTYGFPTIQTTRRAFFYGIIFMLPFAGSMGVNLDVARFYRPQNVFNLLYLGLGASAVCFVTWNYAVKILGAVKTSIYIYLVPVVTVCTAVIVLGEEITFLAGCGIALIMLGVFVSALRPELICSLLNKLDKKAC